MEDNGRTTERTLQHGFEGNRLEEQVWAMAYEQIWPLIHRSSKRKPELQQRREQPCNQHPIARRA